MRIKLTTKDKARFEKYVDRSGGPDACHPWTGYCGPDGYGQLSIGSRLERAHRVAWCLAGNEIKPEKPCILHDCPNGDLRTCCNERHLWDGTRTDNSRDMARKGRGPKSKSGLPFGVYKIKGSSRFYANVWANGKNLYLGSYETPEEASAIALDRKRKEA